MAGLLPNPDASNVVTQNPSGVSNPPDGGNVSSVNTPPNQMQPNGQPAGAAGMGGAPPAPTPQQQAQLATVAHAAKTGLGWNALMGTHTDYQQTPQGPVPVQQQNSAKDLFRSILAGAIMGMGAGNQGPGAGSGWAAASRGAAAAQQGMEQKQQQAQQQAQQQFQNSEATQRETREQQLAQATVQNMHSEMVARDHMSDLQDKEFHDKHNAAVAAVEGNLRAAGGTDAMIPINGQLESTMTAPELAQAYTKDQSIRNAPQGYVRHFLDTTDSSELTFNGLHWVTADGTPVNMSDNTSIKAIDVPVDAVKTKIPTSGKAINAAAGQQLVDPAKTYPIAPLDMVGLNTRRMAGAREQQQIDTEKKKVALMGMQINLDAQKMNHQITEDNKADFVAADKEISTRITSLKDQIKNNTFLDPAVTKQAQTQIDAANKELHEIREKLYPKTIVDALTEADKNADKVAHPEIQSSLLSIPGFNPETATQVANMDPAKIPQFIADAPLPSDKKDQIYKALNITPPASPQVTLPGIIKGAENTAKENFHKIGTFFTGNQ